MNQSPLPHNQEEQVMKKFIGSNIIKAKPMNRLEYNEYRGWQLPEDENGADEGFLVEYLDGGEANHPDHPGCISWSPKAVFENAYRESGKMSFGDALVMLEQGEKVSRSGWNGKDMFVYLVPAGKYPDGLVSYNAYMAIKNVDETVSTWVPSVNDCLAKDWCVVE